MLIVMNLKMNYERELAGVNEIPQFSWELESDQRNVRQEAFVFQIASDADFAESIFDSGRVAGSESAHFVPEGFRLEPLRAYYARVKVFASGEESDFSKPGYFLSGLLDNDNFKAEFVSAETDSDADNSKGTYIRGSFMVKKKVKEAYAAATALGIYKFYLNGRQIDRDELAPGWTSYHKHLLYQVYDVTKELCAGGNRAGAILAAGWYKGEMGFEHARNHYGRQTAFLMQLLIRYEDGTSETICTGDGWEGADAPVVFAEIYDGEIYDAGKEVKDWCKAGSTGGDFHPAERVEFDKNALYVQGAAKVREQEKFPAAKLFLTPKGERVLDFGQNMSAKIHVHARGKAGDVIRLSCFEVLDREGNVYLDNLRKAKQSLTYIFGEKEEITYVPGFTFMGFRYAVIEEYPGEPEASDFTASALYSDMEQTGEFSCSNPMLNQLHHNILWGLKSNFVDVPTDCPQRDERCGWTGDAQIFSRTACYLMNAYSFYEKWLIDVKADTPEDGSIPHIVPDILTGRAEDNWLVKEGSTGAAAWADVAVINPWTLYLMYGDVRILKKQFDNMRGWIDFMQMHALDYIWNYKVQFGDWVALDAEEGSYFGATPNDLTCTAYFAYSTGLFVKICRILGKVKMAQEYENLYSAVCESYHRHFFTEDGHLLAMTQTAQIVSLYFQLVPQEYISNVKNDLLSLLKKEGGHLVTGFVGTPYFCHALSQNGCLKEAYDLLLKEDFPSWLYQVKMGATTVWEHWDGIRQDGSMWSADMNSFNHYAYGAIAEWMYRVMAGIEPDETEPGFRRFYIAPRAGGGLTCLEAGYHCVYGKISTAWEVQENRMMLKVSIPPNTTAVIQLTDAVEIIETDGLEFEQLNQGWQAEAGSGNYVISCVCRDCGEIPE